MTLDQIRSFLAVVKHQNFGQAASEVNLTPSAISKQLSGLQRHLKTKLFRRNGHGLELTEAGDLAVAKAQAIARQIDEFEALFRTISPLESPPLQRLAVAATFSLVADIMPTLIARFEKTNPNIEWNCETGSSERVQQLVRDGKVELALSTYRALRDDLVAEPLRIQQLVFFVHPKHPLAKRRRVALQDVLSHSLVIRSVRGGPTGTHDILRELSQSGLQYKAALRCSSPLVILQAVAKNIGVGLTHLDNLQSPTHRGRFVVLEGTDFKFTTLSYVMFSKKQPLSPLAERFLEMIRQTRRLPKGQNLDEIVKTHQAGHWIRLPKRLAFAFCVFFQELVPYFDGFAWI